MSKQVQEAQCKCKAYQIRKSGLHMKLSKLLLSNKKRWSVCGIHVQQDFSFYGFFRQWNTCNCWKINKYLYDIYPKDYYHTYQGRMSTNSHGAPKIPKSSRVTSSELSRISQFTIIMIIPAIGIIATVLQITAFWTADLAFLSLQRA